MTLPVWMLQLSPQRRRRSPIPLPSCLGTVVPPPPRSTIRGTTQKGVRRELWLHAGPRSLHFSKCTMCNGRYACRVYFHLPHKFAFRDLTHGKSLLPETLIIMGLGTKSILMPKHPPTRKRALESFERLEQDVLVGVFFLGETVYVNLVTAKYLQFFGV